MKKAQVCIIHGGDSFNSQAEFRQWLKSITLSYERLLYAPDWKSWLPSQLPEFDILLPSMPNKQNAQYEDWALYFSKILPFLRTDATLIGHSLGGIFLPRYFADNPPTSKFRKIVLIAAPHSDESTYSLTGFKLQDAGALKDAAEEIHLLFSKDDPVVPFDELSKFMQDLPEAQAHIFNDKQHFNMPAFPELLDIIRS